MDLHGKKYFTDEEMDQHISYLRETLIPDLNDSGLDATAEDFTTSANMIQFLLDELEMIQTK